MTSRRKSRRKSLGQHYLTDMSLVKMMVDHAGIEKGKRVLEIGTGRGVVTRELCNIASTVEGYELDGENFRITERLHLDRLELHKEDAFSGPRDFEILVSSLPYSESSNFVEWLAKLNYERSVVLLQTDFAEKLLAAPGDERYRAMSVISQISSNVEIIRRVSKESFDPPPKVSSVLVVITPKRVLSAEQIHLIKILFSQKRKKLSSALKNLHLELLPTDPFQLSSRVEHLSAEQVGDMLGRIKAV